MPVLPSERATMQLPFAAYQNVPAGWTAPLWNGVWVGACSENHDPNQPDFVVFEQNDNGNMTVQDVKTLRVANSIETLCQTGGVQFGCQADDVQGCAKLTTASKPDVSSAEFEAAMIACRNACPQFVANPPVVFAPAPEEKTTE